MTATATLRAIQDIGGHVWINAGGLAYSMPASAGGPELITALRENKAEILVLLGTVDRWPHALRERFEERAAIMEFDGGFPRADAERLAERDCRNALIQEDQS